MTDQERRHLAQADRHTAECKGHIPRQEELIQRDRVRSVRGLSQDQNARPTNRKGRKNQRELRPQLNGAERAPLQYSARASGRSYFPWALRETFRRAMIRSILPAQ